MLDISPRYLPKERDHPVHTYLLSIQLVSAVIPYSLINSKNEFGLDTYYVPEIIKLTRGQKRTKFYNDIKQTSGQIDWIKSDPRGYIEVASRLNKENSDFRKSVKFVKGWKNYCKERNDNFKLKSFHLEQLITEDFTLNINLTIFDSVFLFFTSLKEDIKNVFENDSGGYMKAYRAWNDIMWAKSALGVVKTISLPK